MTISMTRLVSTLFVSALLALPTLQPARAQSPSPVLQTDGVIKVKSAYPLEETIARIKRDIAAKKAAKSKPASAIEINGKPATAQEAVVEIIADDGELALLREFARFVLAHGEGLRFEPKERPKWAPLRDKVRAVLGIAS